METINSMASTAAKVIWGESDKDNTTTTTAPDTTTTTTTNNTTEMNTDTQHQEPVSGKLGDVSKGEPFDAGNIETTQTPGTETSGVTGTESKEPTRTTAAPTTAPTTAAPTETTDATTASKGASSELPSTTGDHGGFKAAQADIRDPETSATTDPKIEEQRKNVDDTSGLDEGDNPAKIDGPGPKPIAEVAREHGGDAAAVGGDNKTDDDPEGLGGKSESKGTGEQYVKTTGLQADGGDFDATKPGAGKEADRLLEEKGVQNPAAAAAAASKTTEPEATSSGSPDKKEKPSLKDKIKAKLHKN